MISTSTMKKILAMIEAVSSFTQSVATYFKLRNIIPQVGGGYYCPTLTYTSELQPTSC